MILIRTTAHEFGQIKVKYSYAHAIITTVHQLHEKKINEFETDKQICPKKTSGLRRKRLAINIK